MFNFIKYIFVPFWKGTEPAEDNTVFIKKIILFGFTIGYLRKKL